MRPTLSFAAVLWLLASALCAQDEPKSGPRRYTPASQAFTCDLPAGSWDAFEEEDPAGFVVHILGPDSPSGAYRAGIDIHWMEKGEPGFIPYKKTVDSWQRSDKDVDRSATALRPLRIGGTLGRVMEVVETRRLPPDRLPATEEAVHHYMAFVPSGESYYVIRLSSTQDVYLDYREPFLRFLKSFRTAGYK